MIQEFVFRPFVSYGKAEGRGLGLATGTLFRITIPFAIPDEAVPLTSA
jgi:nitrogen-specific signal transduction histidine kinase